MSRQARLNSILELVVERGSIEVDEAAGILNVSLATIRRDFDSLAKRQLLNRTHGGAVATGGSFKLPLTYKVAKSDEVKKRIAEVAAAMVNRFDVVALNGGTTTTEVARAIAAKSDLQPGEAGEPPALTVVTNALNIATELTVRHQIKIVVTGGVARPQSYELTGTFAEEVLKEVVIDIAFVGVEAIDLVNGATARHEDEARVNRQMAARARKVVIVTDSSKFHARAFAVIRPVQDIDTIITDDGIDPIIKAQLIEAGVEIVIA
ncbi:MAG: DeoR/GlpR family DNA-binding transcription regulator [Actinomycetes bacterium]